MGCSQALPIEDDLVLRRIVRAILGAVVGGLVAGCASEIALAPPALVPPAEASALRQILLCLRTSEGHVRGAPIVGGTLISLGENRLFGARHSFPSYFFTKELVVNGVVVPNDARVPVDVTLNGDEVTLELLADSEISDCDDEDEVARSDWVVVDAKRPGGAAWAAPAVPPNVIFDPTYEIAVGDEVIIGGFPVDDSGGPGRVEHAALVAGRVTSGPWRRPAPQGLIYVRVPGNPRMAGMSGGIVAVWDKEHQAWIAVGYASRGRSWFPIGHRVWVCGRFPEAVLEHISARTR